MLLKNVLKYYLLILFSFNVQASPVQKIISLNLCADIILLQLADQSQQLSMTYLVNDMKSYYTIPESAQFNRGLVEEVTVFQADVILAHTFTSSLTLQRLEQLGWPIIKLKAAQTVDDIYQNIIQIGQAIQQEQKALRIVQQMKEALQQLPKLNQQKVLVFYPNGFSVGQQTLANNILSRLNLYNIAQDMGIVFWGKVSLEQMLQHQAEFIILSTSQSKTPALATQLLQHAVLQKSPHIEVANELWQCGSPLILKAMQHIIQKIQPNSIP
ncbi:ABC transporter substrate-binding protein [Candidatus Albibeggiatoa sp. nov. BB20]|uniref:ABC transporter substrate-binding protein n=1 Tax=Candidatus Albibeggiatoa sp. nov. BB20 TaxID=3162723 RepID=UPI0033657922